MRLPASRCSEYVNQEGFYLKEGVVLAEVEHSGMGLNDKVFAGGEYRVISRERTNTCKANVAPPVKLFTPVMLSGPAGPESITGVSPGIWSIKSLSDLVWQAWENGHLL